MAERIGPYELLRRLGSGGMGAVYHARHTVTSQDVALKVLRDDMADDPDLARRFEQEAQALRQLDHPNIVRLLDYGIDGDSHYIAMEIVDGESLQQRLRRESKLSEDETRRVGIAVASALDAAHARRIIHRDIKPGNILLDRNGEIKVSDFGVARVLDETRRTRTGTFLGSLAYAAPEAFDGRADERSDLYSLGIVLYECLTGHVPFQADTPVHLMELHRREPLDVSQIVLDSPPSAGIIAALTLKEPSKRPSARDLVQERVPPIYDWEETKVLPASSMQARRGAGSWRLGIAAFVVAGLASVGAVLAIVRPWQNDATPTVLATEEDGEPTPPQVTSTPTQTLEQSRQVEYDKIAQLSAGLSLAHFEDVLGTPLFVSQSRDRQFRQSLFRRPEYWIQAVSDDAGMVHLMTVTSCSEEFNPVFSRAKDLGDVVLNVSKFSDPPRDPTHIHYFLSGMTANSYFIDEYYFGNPGEYKTYFVGIGEVCPYEIPDGPDGYRAFLFDPRDEEFDPTDEVVASFRSGVIANLYGETSPLVDEEALRAFQIGPDRILVRTAPPDPDATPQLTVVAVLTPATAGPLLPDLVILDVVSLDGVVHVTISNQGDLSMSGQLDLAIFNETGTQMLGGLTVPDASIPAKTALDYNTGVAAAPGVTLLLHVDSSMRIEEVHESNNTLVTSVR